MESGLFGIKQSNRTTDEHWTKNCFNSSFPTSVACYMLERNIPAIYNHVIIEKGKVKVVSETIPISEVFKCGEMHSHELFFSFESVFEPSPGRMHLHFPGLEYHLGMDIRKIEPMCQFSASIHPRNSEIIDQAPQNNNSRK